METDNLFDQAYTELDQHRFDQAKILYRRAALISQPSQSQLQNMGIAEEHEALSFLRNLLDKYPDSVDIQIAVADALVRATLYPQAIKVYSQALLSVDDKSKEALSLRSKRFVAMCKVTRPTPNDLLSEFNSLWEWGGTSNETLAIRRVIVKTLIEYVHHPTSERIFDKLVKSKVLPDAVKQIFYHKMEMLKLLDKINY